jgi:hypothetical protein
MIENDASAVQIKSKVCWRVHPGLMADGVSVLLTLGVLFLCLFLHDGSGD